MEILKKQTATQLIYGLAVLAICLLVSRYAVKLAERALKRGRMVEPRLHTILLAGLKWALYLVSVLVAANILGVPITSFVALFSLAGLAISLAAQGVLSNLAGGLIILGSKPFVLGDYIESDAFAGTVKDIGILNTNLTSPDGKLIFVPNSLIYTSKIVNYTTLGRRRLDLSVSASYDAAPEAVRAAAMKAMEGLTGICPDPEPEVLLESYGDSAIAYIVRLWTAVEDYWKVRYALNERLYGAFRDCGVEMTYPHLNVHMR